MTITNTRDGKTRALRGTERGKNVSRIKEEKTEEQEGKSAQEGDTKRRAELQEGGGLRGRKTAKMRQRGRRDKERGCGMI